MKDLFYRPDLKPDRDYMSDDVFNRDEEVAQEETVDDIQDIDKIREIIKKAEEIENVSNIIPEEIREAIVQNLALIINDLIDPLIPEPGAEPEQVPPNPPEEDPVTTVPPKREPVQKPVPRPPAPKLPDNKFFKPPNTDSISIELEKVGDLSTFIESSFDKDRIDMVLDYVNRLRFIVQQFMRELLYVSQDAGFVSYMDLFEKYIATTSVVKKIPKHLRHSSDRILRGQVGREQKSRLFKKIYNIDQTIYHLRSNRVAHELRQRYYDTDFLKANGYVSLQENDELRRTRREHDQKYEKNMYNYYKYLNSSVIMTDEIVKTFMSEARGKAILKKSGVDVKAGMNEQIEKEKKVLNRLTSEAKTVLDEGKRIDNEKVQLSVKAGKSSTYSGSYGDKRGTVLSPGETGNTELPSSSGSSDIASIAREYVKTRGRGTSNPVVYSQSARQDDPGMKKYADCSSFARRCLLDAGKSDPGWYTQPQLMNEAGTFVSSVKDLQAGDLMFFGSSDGGFRETHTAILPNGKKYDVDHVAIYVGNNEMAECTRSKGLVINNFSTSNWYKNYVSKEFIGGRRF